MATLRNWPDPNLTNWDLSLRYDLIQFNIFLQRVLGVDTNVMTNMYVPVASYGYKKIEIFWRDRDEIGRRNQKTEINFVFNCPTNSKLTDYRNIRIQFKLPFGNMLK